MNESNTITITDTLEIPVSELVFRFSPSRGPGGQHVNRSHTRAILLFDIANSPSLDGQTRECLLQALASRLDKRGILHISVQDSRSQNKNRQLAIARFISLLSKALVDNPARIATEPSPESSARRLAEKQRRSRRKKDRGRDWSDEL